MIALLFTTGRACNRAINKVYYPQVWPVDSLYLLNELVISLEDIAVVNWEKFVPKFSIDNISSISVKDKTALSCQSHFVNPFLKYIARTDT